MRPGLRRSAWVVRLFDDDFIERLRIAVDHVSERFNDNISCVDVKARGVIAGASPNLFRRHVVEIIDGVVVGVCVGIENDINKFFVLRIRVCIVDDFS